MKLEVKWILVVAVVGGFSLSALSDAQQPGFNGISVTHAIYRYNRINI